MIDRLGHEIELICDERGASFGPWTRYNLRELMEEANLFGWRTAKDASGDWKHWCPICWKTQ